MAKDINKGGKKEGKEIDPQKTNKHIKSILNDILFPEKTLQGQLKYLSKKLKPDILEGLLLDKSGKKKLGASALESKVMWAYKHAVKQNVDGLNKITGLQKKVIEESAKVQKEKINNLKEIRERNLKLDGQIKRRFSKEMNNIKIEDAQSNAVNKEKLRGIKEQEKKSLGNINKKYRKDASVVKINMMQNLYENKKTLNDMKVLQKEEDLNTRKRLNYKRELISGNRTNLSSIKTTSQGQVYQSKSNTTISINDIKVERERNRKQQDLNKFTIQNMVLENKSEREKNKTSTQKILDSYKVTQASYKTLQTQNDANHKDTMNGIKKQGVLMKNSQSLKHKEDIHQQRLKHREKINNDILQQRKNKEMMNFFKSLTKPLPKNKSVADYGRDTGYGLLGTIGGILGSFLTSMPSLITMAIGTAIGGVGGVISSVGGMVGAGATGIAGMVGGMLGGGSKNYNVPTKKQMNTRNRLGKIGKATNWLGGKASWVGTKTLKPMAKAGAKVGAFGAKIGGRAIAKGGLGLIKGIGSVFGKVPGLGMVTKFVPGLNALLAAGSIGMSVYDAWNNTTNTKDFLKEAGWNTLGNLGSIATLGMVDADTIKNAGKGALDTLMATDLYRKGKKMVEESAVYDYVINPTTYKKRFEKKAQDYIKQGGTAEDFIANRTQLMSKYALPTKMPESMMKSRASVSDNMKELKLGASNFTSVSSANYNKATTTTNNNSSVVNVYNEPAQNNRTLYEAVGGLYADPRYF